MNNELGRDCLPTTNELAIGAKVQSDLSSDLSGQFVCNERQIGLIGEDNTVVQIYSLGPPFVPQESQAEMIDTLVGVGLFVGVIGLVGAHLLYTIRRSTPAAAQTVTVPTVTALGDSLSDSHPGFSDSSPKTAETLTMIKGDSYDQAKTEDSCHPSSGDSHSSTGDSHSSSSDSSEIDWDELHAAYDDGLPDCLNLPLDVLEQGLDDTGLVEHLGDFVRRRGDHVDSIVCYLFGLPKKGGNSPSAKKYRLARDWVRGVIDNDRHLGF
jgi:hypothetical protein